MDFDRALQSALGDICREGLALKDCQVQALKALFQAKDVFCLLPTNYGKSLIFQLSPFLLGSKSGNNNSMTLIIAPLNSIMKDQVRKLAHSGVSACYLNMTCSNGESYKLQPASSSDDEEGPEESEDAEEIEELVEVSVDLADIEAGKYRLVYAHPEAFLTSPAGKRMLRSPAFRKNVCCVAVDEAHMIQEWGDDFRENFSRIQDIVAIYPSCPTLLLTGTAPPSTREKLCEDLGLENPTIVLANPDRPNISYFKYERLPSLRAKNDLDDILHRISEGLKHQRLQYPQTIMYTSMQNIGYSYRYLEEKLGEAQYEGPAIPENRLFGQYHSAYTAKMNDHTVAELPKATSRLRVVFATIALGMGLDAPYIRKVIHFGAPDTIEKYLQESGRAGRDGEPAEAVLFFNKTDIANKADSAQKKNHMAEYCNSKDTCLRHHLMQYLGFEAPADRHICTCCQYCKTLSLCDDCLVNSLSSL